MPRSGLIFFFFNDTATTEIYTLSLHDALPILDPARSCRMPSVRAATSAGSLLFREKDASFGRTGGRSLHRRSEEHTSELQSQSNLVCRLLLEKKKKTNRHTSTASCPTTRQCPC